MLPVPTQCVVGKKKTQQGEGSRVRIGRVERGAKGRQQSFFKSCCVKRLKWGRKACQIIENREEENVNKLKERDKYIVIIYYTKRLI